jgi:hypothetical protein
VRIYVPVPARDADYEWALPVDDATGHDRLRIETFESVEERWSPVEVKLVEIDEGQKLLPADFPWLGAHALVMRSSAAEVVAAAVEGQAELLPLECAGADLWLLHVTQCCDALDEERSEIVRFSSGRIMTIRRYVFDPVALDGVRCFKIPQMPTGPVFLSGEVVDAVAAADLAGLGVDLVWESDQAGSSG